jgi:hypothetical protein
MKTYYKEYRDGDRRKPTGVICVFSSEALPAEPSGLSQDELWQKYECLSVETSRANGEPAIDDCSLVYLLLRAATCSEEEAATIAGPMVDLIKKSEAHTNRFPC